MSKIALVTGASSGIGAAACRRLAARGFTVYAAARRQDRLAAIASPHILPLPLDLTRADSIATAAARIADEAGRLDVLVNNAGYGAYGALEEVPIDEARRQFEVNLFGLAALTQHVLPLMRAQRSGRIINISSIGGSTHEPFGAWYHATKFALEGLSDCLRLELKPFGIQVVVIAPGGVRTEWGGIACDSLIATSGAGPYAPYARRHAGLLRAADQSRYLTEPDRIAQAIERAALARRPRTRYLLGMGAKPLKIARVVLGDRGFDRLMWSMSQSRRA
ncbi:MAG: SDR family NAD(P)-dependent oxidoreductase [Sphingomonas sp.]|uniref:oxidoreductase n=1 Tax=Sphingomonas sp. TaxID=28214 RepID=UPI0025E40CD3|nr:oxidoreductase [Sphingomonas sp.]MBX9881901.1 SDR family NAD(P)-dependent oxidoreductase [Sphingomonas sp.]